MRHDRRATPLWIASLLLLALATPPSSAVDLAKDLSVMQTLGGEVQRSEWSPDGEHLVYLIDLDFDGTLELRSVESDAPGTEGGVLLAELTPPNLLVPPKFLISPDSQTVVYQAYGAVRLWSVPITGGTATPLSASGDTVLGFTITPDSTTVGFGVRPDTGSDVLLTVPIGGGAPSSLDTPTDDFSLRSIRFTPDSSRAVYSGMLAHLDNALWSAPLDGDPLSELSGVVFGGQTLHFFEISPDGSRVLFGVSDSKPDLIQAVYSVPTVGGTKVLLVSDVWDAKIRGNGTSVLIVYTPDDLSELTFYTRPIDGGSLTLLTTHSGFGNWEYVPAADLVVFELGDALYSFAIPTMTETLLTDDIGRIRNFAVDATGSDVLVRARPTPADPSRLYAVPSGGGTPVRLDDPSISDAEVEQFQFAGDRAVFSRENGVSSVPLAGGPETVLSAPLAFGGVMEDIAVRPPGDRVAFSGGVTASEAVEVYQAPVTGGTNERLVPPLRFRIGEVTRWERAPGGQFIVYLADRDTAGIPELYSVDLVDHSVAKLSPPPVPGQEIDFELVATPTGPRAVFRVDVGAQTDLWSTPVSGATEDDPLVQLNPPEHDVESFAPVPAGGFFAVYVADDIVYRVRLVGAPPLQLASTGSTILELLVSADASRVVFRGGEPGTGDTEVFSVPITGGPAQQLTDLGPGSGDADAFTISPDGSTVLVIVDWKLLLIPIDGSDTADSLGLGFWWAFTPNGQTLVWIGSPGVVARDISTGVETVLHDFGGQAGTLQDGVLAGDRFVYVARVGGNDPATTLFSAPLDGGGPTTLYGAPTFDPGDILDFGVSPDGETVLFRRLGAEEGETVTLVSVPTSGGDAIEIPGTSGTEVYGATPDGAQVVHGGPDGLFAQFVGGSTPTPLTPPDFDAEVLPDLLLEPDSVYFRAVVHPEHTSLFTSDLSGVFGNGFESGDTTRWSGTVGGP